MCLVVFLCSVVIMQKSIQLPKNNISLLLLSMVLAVIGAGVVVLEWRLGFAIIAAGLSLCVGLLIIYRPWLAFGAYLFLLAPHVLLMSALLVIVGLPGSLVKAISAWKEAVLLLLLLAVLLHSVQKRQFLLALPDMLVLLYAGWVALVAFFSLLGGLSVVVLAYGVRDMILPVLLYIIGRSLLLSEYKAQKIFRWVLVAALIFSSLGVFERLFIPLEWYVAIGVPRYSRELIGITYPDYLMGLPENFWTSANSGLLRRAVSVYGSSQGFALAFLLFFPFYIYGLLTRSLPEHRFVKVTFVILMLGLFLTITRFTIMTCLFLLLLAGLLTSQRARSIVVRSLFLVSIAAVVLLLASDSVRLLVINTLTFTDHSASTRLVVWAQSIDAIVSQPFGYGISTTGQTAGRFGNTIVGIEGQYPKIGVELGLIGLLLYILMLAFISMYLMRAAYQISSPYQRSICFAVALTFIGLALNSATTEWHNAIALVYPVWWLAGSCVTCGARQACVLKEV